MAHRKKIQIKRPGSFTAYARRHGGLNKDGSVSRVFARKVLRDPNASAMRKRQANFFLNFSKKRARR